jgi:SIR2-like domain
LGDELRRGESVFVRLHGSTDAISDIVLTRTDYARVAQTGREVFDILRALALTSTILFVGYSLDDPDIQLVMQAIGRPGPVPEAHFMLTRQPATASRIAVFRESFGVSVLTYTGAHTRGTTAMKELAQQVEAARAAAA